MNKKVVIAIVASLVVVGGIIAVVAASGKKSDENNDAEKTTVQAKEVDHYALESFTSNNKITFELAKDLGYEAVENTAKGSMILANEKDGSKITLYYKHSGKNSIIAGEKSYSADSYYGYREFTLGDKEACEVKYNKMEDGKPYRIDFNMVLNQEEGATYYNGVAVQFERSAAEDGVSVDLEKLYASDDIQNMLKSMTFIASESEAEE